MSTGLNATFEFLTKTENEAAVDILTAALDNPYQPTQHRALRALMDRRSAAGHQEVFRRLPALDEQCRSIVNERPERLLDVVGAAVQDPDKQVCAAACNGILSLRLYESLPVLISVLSNAENPNTVLAARTTLNLTELFYAELSRTDDQPKRKNEENLRIRITSALENAVRKFHRHQRTEVVEALLLVAKSKSITLRQMLQRPDEKSHQPIVDLLSNSSRGGVIRLLLGFFEDPQMPRVVSKVICDRCDVKFVENLLRAVHPRPSKAVAKTLTRIDSIAWAQPGHELFQKLDDLAQECVVQLLMGTAINRQQVLEVIGYLLLEGKPGGRRAAARALAEFPGPEAAALTIRAINDEDPQVRARLLVQLRPRRIPAAFSLLIRMVDSPEEEIREALRKALPEFTFRQFLANLDTMPETLQPLAGHMVSKIDTESISKLTAEMASPSPVRRRLAVQATSAMGMVHDLEEIVIKLLSDEDHIVRVAAARALADCKSMPTWEALRDALLDRSVVVQEAAEQSLEWISRSLLQHREEEAQMEEEDEVEEEEQLEEEPEEAAP